jgi:hypothetical protein
VPVREPLKACTSQPRISGYLARTHYLSPEGDGHPVALADITQCDNSSPAFQIADSGRLTSAAPLRVAACRSDPMCAPCRMRAWAWMLVRGV